MRASPHSIPTLMSRRTLLDYAEIPGSENVMKLYQDRDECYITVSGRGELMSTRRHGSEDALGRLPCEMLARSEAAHVLIGGLGMGFTLAAALAATGPEARVVVAELVPEIVEWNRGVLGDYAGRPLEDARTRVHDGDVGELLRDPEARFDVIALDVDNGPEGFSATGNDWLYSPEGIACARDRLAPGGVLAYWSATSDRRFTKRLRECGLALWEKSVHAHGRKGTKHTIWLAWTLPSTRTVPAPSGGISPARALSGPGSDAIGSIARHEDGRRRCRGSGLNVVQTTNEASRRRRRPSCRRPPSSRSARERHARRARPGAGAAPDRREHPRVDALGRSVRVSAARSSRCPASRYEPCAQEWRWLA